MVGLSIGTETKKVPLSSYGLSTRNPIMKTPLSVKINGDLHHVDH